MPNLPNLNVCCICFYQFVSMATLICWLQMNGSVTGVVNTKCRCGIGLCNVGYANVFEVFLGAGLNLYKYESRVFNLRWISYFAVWNLLKCSAQKAIMSHLDSATQCCKIEVLWTHDPTMHLGFCQSTLRLTSKSQVVVQAGFLRACQQAGRTPCTQH